MIFGDANSTRNALTDDKHRIIANALMEAGFEVESILYHDTNAAELEVYLQKFDAILVWVNPIEQGNDRRRLDALLLDVASKGIYVSTHPEVILKIGTKKVLYTTRQMDWGGDTELYSDFDDFASRFFRSLDSSGIRILKQYRGNGGNGVFKVRLAKAGDSKVKVVHAAGANEEAILSQEEFLKEFRPFFDHNGVLLNQRWAQEITNGMVRCYLTGTTVSGFGYQESNALCPQSDEPESKTRPISRRYYFSEYCGLFQDLRRIMESKWVPELQKIHAISDSMMPLLWDVDLFINDINTQHTETKYTLCEINVSCVSPFPESCVPHIVSDLKARFMN
jgi:hypothetical protein